MEFPNDVARKSRSINDQIVEVPQPYTEGQTITAGEAAALNQVLAENVSNNLRQKLKDGPGGKGEDQYDDAGAQTLVDEYLAEYEMGVRSGGGRSSDPIEREALRLATDAAKELVKQKGKKLKEVNLTEIRDAIYAANEQALTEKAKKLVAAANKATDAIDMSNVSI